MTDLTGWPLCHCRPGAHVWLWASGGSDAEVPEGMPCACGQERWHRESEQDWRADVERRLAEIERMLEDRQGEI